MESQWYHKASDILDEIGSGDGLLSAKCQAIIRTNADCLSVRP